MSSALITKLELFCLPYVRLFSLVFTLIESFLPTTLAEFMMTRPCVNKLPFDDDCEPPFDHVSRFVRCVVGEGSR